MEEKYVIEKTSCGRYRIYLQGVHISSSGILEISYSLINLKLFSDNNLGAIKTIHVKDLKDWWYYIDIEDGIYALTIYDNYDISWQTYLYSICSIENCFNALLRQIYCKDDTCSTLCDESAKNTQRNELLKLHSFAMLLSGIMYSIKSNSIGTITVNNELYQNVKTADDIYDKILEIINRCGSCSDNIVVASKKCGRC